MTTRAPTGDVQADDHEAGGMGLGLFIAKTLLERTGARLSLANRRSPQSGAIVRVEWPRALIDIDQPEADPSRKRIPDVRLGVAPLKSL